MGGQAEKARLVRFSQVWFLMTKTCVRFPFRASFGLRVCVCVCVRVRAFVFVLSDKFVCCVRDE